MSCLVSSLCFVGLFVGCLLVGWVLFLTPINLVNVIYFFHLTNSHRLSAKLTGVPKNEATATILHTTTAKTMHIQNKPHRMVPKTPKILRRPSRIPPLHKIPTKNGTLNHGEILNASNLKNPRQQHPKNKPGRHQNRTMPNLQTNQTNSPPKIRFQPLRGLLERLYRHLRTLTEWSKQKTHK